MTYESKRIQQASLGLAAAVGRRIGEHKVLVDPDILASLAKDESHCAPCMPDVAIRPRSTDDVVVVLEEAERCRVPVTPRGGGTGKSGGAIPCFGGAVLDTSYMSQLLEIDTENLLAVVEPGLVTGVFQAAVEAEGLFYPPDPNSLETCCLGGNVAHNAGGPRAFKYGVTRRYVLGLEAVLVGGRQIATGRKTIKTVAGYDLAGLLVGSEGTLAAFTKLVLRLVRKPPQLATLLVRFGDEVAAGEAVARIVAAGLVPRVMELMDGMMVETLRLSGAGAIPEDTGALLLAEIDGDRAETVESDAVRLAEVCEAAGAVDVLMARHGTERDKLWAARRNLSDAVKQRSRHKVAEDVVVPRASMGTLLARLKMLAAKHQTLIASYGHAGDGNMHVNVLWDDDDWDPEPVVEDLFRLVLELEGSITGEHGVGLAKKKYLPWEKDHAALEVMRGLKGIFDPKCLLNPGKIFESAPRF